MKQSSTQTPQRAVVPQTPQRTAVPQTPPQPFTASQKSADGKGAEAQRRTIRRQRSVIVILAIATAIAFLLTCIFGGIACRSCKSRSSKPDSQPLPTEGIEPKPDPGSDPETDPGSKPEKESFLFGGAEINSGSVIVSGFFFGIDGTADEFREITENEIRDLVRLCPDLEILTLSHCFLETYEPLSGLTKLKTLVLRDCSADGDPRSLTDIGWIGSLTDLTKLDISGNPISDFEPLKELRALEDLHFHHTDVKEVDFIAYLPKLRQIHIGCSFDGKPMEEITWGGIPVSWSEAIDHNPAIKTVIVEKTEERIREDLKAALDEGKLDKLN